VIEGTIRVRSSARVRISAGLRLISGRDDLPHVHVKAARSPPIAGPVEAIDDRGRPVGPGRRSCSGGNDSAGGEGTRPTPTHEQTAATSTLDTDATATCEKQADLPLGDDLFFREVGSSRRQYQLYVPTSYRAERPLPLVLDFHALRSDPLMEENFNGFETVAKKVGFVLARPQGVSGSWSLFDGTDAEYVEAVLADVRALVCVDPARTYAAGMSQGGHLATQLACRLPGTFAAVATVAVLDHPVGCSPEPTPIIAFAGRKDAIYDIEEGLNPSIFESANPGAPPGARPGSLKAEAEAWAATNRCKSEPAISARRGTGTMELPVPEASRHRRLHPRRRACLARGLARPCSREAVRTRPGHRADRRHLDDVEILSAAPGTMTTTTFWIGSPFGVSSTEGLAIKADVHLRRRMGKVCLSPRRIGPLES